MYSNKNIKLKVTPEIARIHAHVCGDGSVYIKNSKRSPGALAKHKRRNIYKKEWTIEYYNKDLELVKEFIRDFKIAFNRNKKTLKNMIKFRSVKHIVEKLELTNKNSYNWYVPKLIMDAPPKIIKNWLRAFFDDEAYVNPRKRIVVKSMNQAGLKQIVKLLRRLDIESKVTGPNCDRSFYLYINRPYLKKYSEKVGFLMRRKAGILNLYVKEMGRPERSGSNPFE